MTGSPQMRGAAPVGFVAELDSLEAASVMYLRLWSDGQAQGTPRAQTDVWTDFTSNLGPEHGRRAQKGFEDLCSLCARYGRRPLMRHSVQCKCLGADESCFANFIATAATGDRDDALLIATLLVRADVAPLITSLAADFGLALMRMTLAANNDLVGGQDHDPSHSTTLH